MRNQALKEGNPVWFVFKNGLSIQDCHNRPKFYLTDGAKNTYAPWDSKIIEYVPIVRCGRCVHWPEDTMLGNGECYCDLFEKYMPPNSFCSYGEKEVFD